MLMAASVCYNGEPSAREVIPLPDSILSEKGATLPPGRYWIGDPAYAAGLEDSAWKEWVKVALPTSEDFKNPVAGAQYDAYPVVGVNTGRDEVFYDQEGVAYPVDAFMIGVTPAELIEELKLAKNELDSRDTWVVVEEPTLLHRDKNGTILFGEHIEIPTEGEDEREENL